MEYISQLVRIGRICSNYSQFTYKLAQRLICQGFRYSALCVAFGNLQRSMHKFWIDMVVVYANILRMVCVCQQWMGS